MYIIAEHLRRTYSRNSHNTTRMIVPGHLTHDSDVFIINLGEHVNKSSQYDESLKEIFARFANYTNIGISQEAVTTLYTTHDDRIDLRVRDIFAIYTFGVFCNRIR